VDAHEELKAASVIVVDVRTEDGLTGGFGQIHGSPLTAICAWIERFGEIIRGMDALAHVSVWDRLLSLTCPRPGGIAGPDGLPPPPPARRAAADHGCTRISSRPCRAAASAWRSTWTTPSAMPPDPGTSGAERDRS
jgi:hypothetical protein